MASRYYRDRLHAVLTSANDESIDTSATDWSTNAFLLQGVAVGIRASSATLGSEIEGNTGRAMVAHFKAISDKLEQDSADMAKGAGALGLAHTGAIEAIKARNGIMLSGPMNQPPTKPEGPTPGIEATPEQVEAVGNYNTQVAQYEANEAAMEENARVALVQMDQQYAEATVIMKEIHGEPDPVDETPTTPAGPSGPGYLPPPPITGDARQPKDHGGLIFTDHGDRDPHVRPPDIPGFEHDPDDGVIVNEDRWLMPPREDESDPVPAPETLNTTHGPTTNVSGSTDGGTSYQGTGSSSAPGASSVTGSSSAGVGGAATAGAAGIGLGAGAIKGGGITPAAAPSSGAVRGIGAGGRPGAPGSLGKGVTAAGSSSAAKGSAGRAGGAGSASRAGAGARTGAVGANGSASRSSAAKGGARRGAAGSTSGKGSSKGAKGKGLFRRGNNGSSTGGRSNKKKDDERGEQRDALVYEQDWLGDDATAPGVLD